MSDKGEEKHFLLAVLEWIDKMCRPEVCVETKAEAVEDGGCEVIRMEVLEMSVSIEGDERRSHRLDRHKEQDGAQWDGHCSIQGK